MDEIHARFDWTEASWSDRVAYLFNRTALGLGVLIGIWALIHQQWWRLVQVLFMMAIYFGLHYVTDAPGYP